MLRMSHLYWLKEVWTGWFVHENSTKGNFVNWNLFDSQFVSLEKVAMSRSHNHRQLKLKFLFELVVKWIGEEVLVFFIFEIDSIFPTWKWSVIRLHSNEFRPRVSKLKHPIFLASISIKNKQLFFANPSCRTVLKSSFQVVKNGMLVLSAVKIILLPVLELGLNTPFIFEASYIIGACVRLWGTRDSPCLALFMVWMKLT